MSGIMQLLGGSAEDVQLASSIEGMNTDKGNAGFQAQAPVGGPVGALQSQYGAYPGGGEQVDDGQYLQMLLKSGKY